MSRSASANSSATEALTIEPVPAFKDNYLWLLHRGDRAAIVDPGDAEPVLRRLDELGLRLACILVTHHHADHIGGLAQLKAATGAFVYGPHNPRIDGIDQRLREGDSITVFEQRFDIIEVPGHTLDHIAYFAPALPAVFCGDTLFAAGCGRLFEGTPEQMTASLAKLARLPDATRVYCAHEYTLANLRFALAVESDNAALRERQQRCAAQRARNEPTLPSTIAEERATNPFLRCDEPTVRRAAEAHSRETLRTTSDTFAVIRGWKDRF